MSRIQQVFKNKKVLIPFIAADDLDLSVTEVLVPTMAGARTDSIELGMLFSDPVAEGIIIQEADLRVLASGATTDEIFDTAHRTHQKTDVPLVSMTYINPVFTYSVDKFVGNAADYGIDVLTVPDMPFREWEGLLPAYKEYDMTLIYLVAPTPRERTQVIVGKSDEFVYCISSLGVTDTRNEITTNIKETVGTVKQGRDVPRAIGFGISTPKQTSRMTSQTDGVITGSVIVRMTVKYGTNCAEPACDHVKQMKTAVGVQTVRTGTN